MLTTLWSTLVNSLCGESLFLGVNISACAFNEDLTKMADCGVTVEFELLDDKESTELFQSIKSSSANEVSEKNCHSGLAGRLGLSVEWKSYSLLPYYTDTHFVLVRKRTNVGGTDE